MILFLMRVGMLRRKASSFYSIRNIRCKVMVLKLEPSKCVKPRINV